MKGIRKRRTEMKRGSFLGTLLVAFFTLSVVLTIPVLGEDIKGSEKKGKFIFRAKCKECHWPDEEGGDVTPITFTQKQWQSFFDRYKHKRKKDIWHEQFTDEELIHVKTYLIEHASDSEQPETCG